MGSDRSLCFILDDNLLGLQGGPHRVLFDSGDLLLPQLVMVGLKLLLGRPVSVLVDLLQPHLGSFDTGLLLGWWDWTLVFVNIIYCSIIGRHFFTFNTRIIIVIGNTLAFSLLRLPFGQLGQQVQVTLLWRLLGLSLLGGRWGGGCGLSFDFSDGHSHGHEPQRVLQRLQGQQLHLSADCPVLVRGSGCPGDLLHPLDLLVTLVSLLGDWLRDAPGAAK